MKNDIPKHVSIIMDGNGRWAEARHLKRSEGHLAGSNTLENLAIHAIDLGVETLSVFAFSTDNFKRTKEEVDYLMNLFIEMFTKKYDKIIERKIKVVFSGRREGLSRPVLAAMDRIVKKTSHFTNGTLNICLNYGGQEEIVDAALRLHEALNDGSITKEMVDKKSFAKYLYQDLPPIDLLIRTSGEMRVSNYMIYEMAYAEFYFTNTLFPDFDAKEFDKAILAYQMRDRKFGGNSKKS